MRSYRRSFSIPSLAAVLLAILSLPAEAQAPGASEVLAEQLAKADELLGEKQFSAAAEAYQRASELAGGSSAEALLGLAIAEYRSREFERAVIAARQLLDLDITHDQRIAAYNTLGLSLAVKKDASPDRLAEAEEAFREVLDLSEGEVTSARLSLASVLRRQDRECEALVEARAYLHSETSPPLSEHARVLICDLRRSLPGGAPPPRAACADPMDETDPPEADADQASCPQVIAEDVQKPEKIFTPQPQYNEVARRQRIEGVVIVQAIIDREGCVVSTKVLKELPEGLSEQAVNAIRRWVFRPATLSGEPVDVYYNLTVNFRLQKRSRT